MDKLDDNTRIVRFLDVNGAEKSIGRYSFHGDETCFSFRFGSLDEYIVSEGFNGDPLEKSPLNTCGGRSYLGCTAFVSCWSIWDDRSNNPWSSIHSQIAKKNEIAIVSTIGQVREICNEVNEINQRLYQDNLFICHGDGKVEYYDPNKGSDRAYDPCNPSNPYNNIFLKRSHYQGEQEYRFVFVHSGYPAVYLSGGLSIKTSQLFLCNYPLFYSGKKHFINQVFLKKEIEKLNQLKANLGAFVDFEKIA